MTFETLKNNVYPGRGIMIGKSADGKNAVIAYFIMGRSENSRNRKFVPYEEGIRTQAVDPSKLQDPSLIIYAPVRVLEDDTIVTNGDQTDTIYEHLKTASSFEQALATRCFEPDSPNYTPRISGIVSLKDNDFSFKLSILKANTAVEPPVCDRFFYDYESCAPGEGRLIHTYKTDGSPIPSFEGEPTKVEINLDIDELTNEIWSSLNADNKVALFVRYINLETKEYETRIVNKEQ